MHAVSKAAKVILILYVGLRTVPAQRPPGPPSVAPRIWDEQALAKWATPLASLKIRPGHFSEDEYYRAPVDNYRTYPVYDPDREPPGYWESLRRKAPEPLIDIDRIGPSFDWVTAGKRVWAEVDVPFFRLFDKESISLARSGAYIRKNEKLLVVRPDGTLAHYRWVITPGGIGLSITACSSCHTRFLDDGTAISGAGFVGHRISDSLLDRMSGQLLRISYQGDGLPMSLYRQFGVPWLKGDIHETLKTMPDAAIAGLFEAEIAGVSDRPNGSPFYMTKVPDLIGFRDRTYIDHSATHQHRNIGDLMRYAALVEYSDSMDFGSHRMLTDVQRKVRVRWPDELLFALAQYIYSLQPPPNPNPSGQLSERGKAVFAKPDAQVAATRRLFTRTIS